MHPKSTAILLVLVFTSSIDVDCASISPSKLQSVLGSPSSQEECFSSARNASLRDGRRAADADQNALTALFAGEVQFSVDLFKAIYKNSGGKNNVFYSPFSVFSALLVSYFGAQGRTEQQLAHVLGLNGTDKVGAVQAYKAIKFMRGLARDQGLSKYDFDVANRVYFDSHINFRQCMKDVLEDDIQVVDFVQEAEAALERINSWVSEVTRGKIPELLTSDAINPQTRMAIVNAAYFKGQWASQFKAANTKLNSFFSSPKETTAVNMMFQKGSYRHAVSEDLQAHVLEMPYLGNDVSFFVILPPEEGTLEETISRLNVQVLKDALFSTFPVTMEVGLPKFRMEQTIDLINVLTDIGVTDIFDGASADFSGFTSSHDLSISKAVHKAFIDVNEEGSEAAGATSLADVRMARPLGPTRFVCDRPFLYLIYDNLSDSILFMGVFKNPKQ